MPNLTNQGYVVTAPMHVALNVGNDGKVTSISTEHGVDTNIGGLTDAQVAAGATGTVGINSTGTSFIKPDGTQSSVSGGGSARLKIVGRNYAFGLQDATSGADIGGTHRKVHKAVGPITQLAALIASHTTGNPGGIGFTETTTPDSSTLRLSAQYRLSFEDLSSSKISYSGVSGRKSFVVDASGPALQTDPVGVNIAAGGAVCITPVHQACIDPQRSGYCDSHGRRIARSAGVVLHGNPHRGGYRVRSYH